MIVNSNILLAVATIIGIVAAFIFIKKMKSTLKDSWRIALGIVFAVAALFYWGIDTLSTKVVILEGDTEWNYSHKTVQMYGSADLELSNGEVISTNGLGLKLGKTYCFNCTNRGMLFYATVYTPGQGIFIFDTSKDMEIPESYYIDSEYYDELSEMPDFWFRKAPQTVETSEHLLVQLWNSVFNIGDIRWAVIPYTVETE